MSATEKTPFSLKHTLGSTLAWWYTLFLGWTTRIYWFKTELFMPRGTTSNSFYFIPTASRKWPH